MAAEPLWKPIASCSPSDQSADARSCLAVTVAKLKPEAPRLDIRLPAMTFDIALTRLSATAVGGGVVWDGIAKDGTRATFSAYKSALVGDVARPDGRLYRLRTNARGVAVVEQVDLSKLKRVEPTLPALPVLSGGPSLPRPPAPTPLPPGPPPPPPPAPAPSPMPAPAPAPSPASTPAPAPTPPGPASETPAAATCPNPATQINALVLYTSKAAGAAGGEDSIRALINQATLDTNHALTDSAVNASLNLVDVQQIGYDDETRPIDRTLGILIDPTDVGSDSATLNNVQGLRASAKADVVFLVIDIPLQVAGTAYTLSPFFISSGASFSPYAYAVVTQSALTMSGGYGFTHELGHLMGANHETSTGGAFDYSRGMSGAGKSACQPWGTLMAGPVCNGCTQLRLWSTPKLTRCSEPIGIADLNDNARTIQDTRTIVSQFGCSLAGASPSASPAPLPR